VSDENDDGDDEQGEGEDGPVEELGDEVVFALDELALAGEDEDDGVDRDEQDREVGENREPAKVQNAVGADLLAQIDPTSSARRPLPSDMGIAPVLFGPVLLQCFLLY
jgi:hypothetical protein